jgi:acetoacetyl-CoA synthetase
MIDRSSTAAVLNEPPAPPYSPLLSLKSGVEWPPIFMVHGLGGSASEFLGLARDMGVPSPIFGIQERGLDGTHKPLETVEDMAQTYLRAVERLQTTGPYLLVGHSFGGLVALEMARALSAKGKRIGLLAMLDAYPHASLLPATQRIRLLGRRAMRRFAGYGAPDDPGAQSVRKSMSPAKQRVRESTYRALRKYRPQFYDGSIKFIRATVPTNFPDPRVFWPHLATTFELDTVPGDHLAMLSTHSKSLASVLNRLLKDALCLP